LIPARLTAVLGTLVLGSLALAAAARQTSPAPASQPATSAAQSAPAGEQPKSPQTSPAKPRNYIALLPAPAFNRTTVVIDPSHGGNDNGSRISDETVEKSVTLALAFRLRSLLTARGFNVVLTRDSDDAREANPPFAPLTLDDRAGIANHERASACLLLHATGSGTGVHLYSSELQPAAAERVIEPWLTAQGPWVTESQSLAQRVSDALTRARVPEVNGSASVRPMDSLTCPALVIELAPQGDDPDSINDESYQQHVAEAITGALVFWKDAAQPPPRLAPETTTSANATSGGQP
jgi:N-acetylmuramoyl-L-alanine amidase